MEPGSWNPQRILEASGAYWLTCTLHAAVKLDLFTLLGGNELDVDEIAGRVHADTRGLTQLLNALVAMGLLTRSAGRYANTPEARTFLSRDSKQYLGHMIMHHHHLVDSWSRLDQAVLSGKPVRERPFGQKERFLEDFLMAMHTMATLLAPLVAEAIDLSAYSRLLDLGGGPGTYAVHFCLRNPGLEATVFDLPRSQAFAERTIQEFGLADRVRFHGGNFLEDPLPGGHDVVWASHILHSEGPEACVRILKKAISSLRPYGRILVHDFLLNDDRDSPLFPALFSLNMLLGTEKGQAYSEREIREMLARAGAEQIQRLAFQGLNGSGIIEGTVGSGP